VPPGSIQHGSGGAPLAAPVQSAIENSLGVNLDSVRVHTDSHANEAARSLSARAFAYGDHIFLGQGEKPTDLHLVAHEAAHVVQQRAAPVVQKWSSAGTSDGYEHEAHQASAAVLSGQPFAVRERTSGPQILRSSFSDFGKGLLSGAKDVLSGAVDVVKSAVDVVGKVLNWFADKAYIIPGYRMFTIVVGFNPINMSKADTSTANICRAAVEIMPGGALISQALDKYSVFDKVAPWIDKQIKTLGLVASSFKKAIDDFINGFKIEDLWPPDALWERAKGIFTEPVNRLLNFIKGLAADVIKFIKDAILKPLAALASKTDGWDLLCAVLGSNPITGEEVPRTAETIIPGVLKLIGQQEVWENIKKANALARISAWFKGALNGLLGFVKQVPSMLKQAVTDLEIEDILLLPKAIIKIGKAFLGFLGKFGSWAGEQVWALLQIIFEVVAPAVVPYLKKAAAAFRTILKNPGGFVGNLVKAAKQGFLQFGTNFLAHLKAALIGWLTGTLEGANIYIPQAFSFMEIIKFVLSVLGLTWQNIRGKLVKAIGETAVKALEAGFDIVVTLVTQGPAAAWQKIQEGISNLKEMVIDGVMSFVKDSIVQVAITKLLSMLSPVGAFIQAIIAIYNTIMFFVERLKQIAQVAAAFIDSISAIANGIIAAAANKVESTLGGLLTLVVSFLARIAGLGKVSDAVKDIVNKIRAPIDKALDKVVDWIVTMAKKLGKLILQAVVGKDTRTPEEKQRDLNRAVSELRPKVRELTRSGPPGRLLPVRLTVWKLQYRLTDLSIQPSGSIVASINPTQEVDRLAGMSRQQALAVVLNEINQYFAGGRSPQTAAAVLSTGQGTRPSPFDPGAIGNRARAMQAVLREPGALPGETSFVMGVHRGEPVPAILQRTRQSTPGTGEVFGFDPATGRRVTLGPYPRSGEIPGKPFQIPSGPSAATVLAGPFGGSESRATGYIEEMTVEGRVPRSLTGGEAHAAAAGALLQQVEGSHGLLAMATVPSAMQATTHLGVPLQKTQGGPVAASGSAGDTRKVEQALSRFDPVTGQLRAPGSPGILPDPHPRGVKDPERSGSETRAGQQIIANVDALANTILEGMVTGDLVLGSSEQIAQRTRDFLTQQYGRRG
jgi:Domain of unknown function (DUF4157)